MRRKHLYLLDVLRGLASLSIVLWHYQQFFWVGAEGSTQLQRETLPLYAILWPFYDKGYVAVDVFFGISGLVFYYLYSEALYDRAVSWRQFWLLRFSRLSHSIL
jgi:peptidoglycan/LPS O-acetylase OafA/YrhL